MESDILYTTAYVRVIECRINISLGLLIARALISGSLRLPFRGFKSGSDRGDVHIVAIEGLIKPRNIYLFPLRTYVPTFSSLE